MTLLVQIMHPQEAGRLRMRMSRWHVPEDRAGEPRMLCGVSVPWHRVRRVELTPQLPLCNRCQRLT